MKHYDWDELKNDWLKKQRGIGFEDIVVAINEGGLLTILSHPNRARYSNQKLFVIKIRNYVYMVPFIEDESKYFLKTIYASRKMTKQYLKGDD